MSDTTEAMAAWAAKAIKQQLRHSSVNIFDPTQDARTDNDLSRIVKFAIEQVLYSDTYRAQPRHKFDLNSPMTHPTCDVATLERYQWDNITEYSQELAEEPEFTVIRDNQRRVIREQIRQYVWGGQAGRKEYSYPSDWWEALKERWAPKWFKRRWPVVYTKVGANVIDLFPQISFPRNLGRVARVAMWN